MRMELLRFNGAVERDPAIEVWMKEHAGELAAIAGRGVKRRLRHGASFHCHSPVLRKKYDSVADLPGVGRIALPLAVTREPSWFGALHSMFLPLRGS